MITVTEITDANGLWENCKLLIAALKNAPEKGHFQWGSGGYGRMANGKGVYDKLGQLEVMNAAGVRTVPFTDDLAIAREWVASGATVFGRFRDHTKGTDITVNKVRNTTRSFWTKYVPSKEEWRIHSFDGLSIARWLKRYPPMPAVITEEIIRKRAAMYNATARIEPPAGLRRFAHSMVKACAPLTYGACDILVGEDGRFYALEVNTAPELDDYTLDAYVRAVRRRFAR